MAVGNDDISSQVALAKELTKVMTQLQAALDKVGPSLTATASALGNITNAAKEMAESTGELGEQFDVLNDAASEHADSLGTANKAMTDMTAAAQSGGNSLQGLDDTLGGLNSGTRTAGTDWEALLEVVGKGDAWSDAKAMMSKFKGVLTALGPVIAGVVGFWKGLMTGLKNAKAILSGAGSWFMSLTKSIWNIGLAIISIPFKLLQGLVDMAARGAGINIELAQAIERVRKSFGDLRGPGASAIMSVSRSLKGFSETGLGAFQVFGTMAERMDFVREMAEGLGATFSVLANDFREQGGYIAAYQKGLGLTAESMKGIAQRAITMGKPWVKVLQDVAKQSLGLGKSFGLDQKLISRDIGKAITDVKNFGALTVKEIGQAAVYARKLGVELDHITGVLGQFDTFDNAAESASKLSQAFGVNIDAFELMQAQSPADIVDKLKHSFNEAGVDASAFNRQQLTLLKNATGLDEATAKQVFSQHNHGVALADVKQKSEQAAKAQESQGQTMKRLADSIERIIKTIEMAGSFWEMFIRGMNVALQKSPEFEKIMHNIRQSLMLAFWAGRQFGEMLIKLTPIKQIFAGLAEYFDPVRFQKLFSGINNVASEINTLLNGTAGPDAIKGALAKVQNVFTTFLMEAVGPGSKILGGFAQIFEMMAKLIGPAVGYVLNKLGEAFGHIADFLADFISGKQNAAMMSARTDAAGFLFRFLTPLWEGVQASWPKLSTGFTKLVTQLGRLLWAFFKRPDVQKVLGVVTFGLLTVIFGPAAFQAALGVAGSLLSIGLGQLFTYLVPIIVTNVGAWMTGAGGAAFTSAIGTFFTTTLPAIFASYGPQVIVVLAAVFGMMISSGVKEFGPQLTKAFGQMDGTMMAAGAGVLKFFTLGLLSDDIIVWLIGWGKWLQDKVFAAIDGIFGPISPMIKTQAYAAIVQLQGIGDILLGIFTGDFGRAFSGLGRIVWAGLTSAFNNARVLAILPVVIQRLSFMALEYLSKGLGWVFTQLSNLPLFGGFFSALGEFFTTLGEVFGELKNIFTELMNVANEVWNVIAEVFTVTGQMIMEGLAGVAKALGLTGDSMGSMGEVATWLWKNLGSFLVPGLGRFHLILIGVSWVFKEHLIPVLKGAVTWLKDIVQWLKEGVAWWQSFYKGKDGNVGHTTKTIAELDAEKAAKKAAATKKPADTSSAAATAPGAKSRPGVSEPAKPSTSGAKGGWLSNLFGDTSGETKQAQKDVKAVKEQSAVLTQEMASSIKNSTSAMLSLIPSLRNLANAVPGIPKINTAGVKTLIESIGDIAKLSTQLYSIPAITNDTDSEDIRDNIVNALESIITVLEPDLDEDDIVDKLRELGSYSDRFAKALSGTKSFSTVATGMETLTKDIKTLFDSMNEVGTNADTINARLKPNATNLHGVLGHIKDDVFGDGLLTRRITETNTMAADFTTKIKTGSLAPAIDAISKIVKQVNELDSMLGSLPKIDLNTRLASFAKGAGLGGSATYNVKSNAIVLNATMYVTLDVGTVERAIIMRSDSVINGHLNAIEQDAKLSPPIGTFVEYDKSTVIPVPKRA